MSGIKTVVPYIVVRGAEAAIGFYRKAFDAEEIFRMTDPTDGRIGHAELRVGSSILMLADEYPDFGAVSPDTIGGTAVTLHLATQSVDADLERARQAGATVLREPADQSFGERVALIVDPFGHRWMLSQTIEQVSPAEMQRRWEEETRA
ncbi:putative enzyme related to lactoylglutathione lyase [Hartmannibacter diazotrophicus]|uniref:Putative enzyme related to lactoylglutathione lyase n=1 Tax=Hartmannibacter diazotrophicus TaxID=1482074 RepID=A0A2C9D7V5_9HYPH|nr:VOC family protein [Hartmannibacter diazotrophicus]SON56402.1 putative enzyme related to lactoylglutathione lyase [Hartmannibacter diazotrophicus]